MSAIPLPTLLGDLAHCGWFAGQAHFGSVAVLAVGLGHFHHLEKDPIDCCSVATSGTRST